MEHRGVRYEIKIAPGGRRWVWEVHTSPQAKARVDRGLPPWRGSCGREGNRQVVEATARTQRRSGHWSNGPRMNSKTLSGRNDMGPLSAAPFLALPASGPMTTTMSSKTAWSSAVFFSRRSRAAGSAQDVIEWPQQRHTPRGG